jgi:hypothetical protein
VSLVLRGAEIIYEVKGARMKAFGRTLSLPLADGKLLLRALLDRASIELFGNCGEVTHSGVFFPDPSDRSLSLTVSGGQAHLHRLVVRELRSIFSEESVHRDDRDQDAHPLARQPLAPAQGGATIGRIPQARPINRTSSLAASVEFAF